MKQSKTLTEGALFAGIYLVLLLITFFIPLIGFLSFFLLSVPYIIYGARHGLRPSVVLFLATVLFSVLFATIVSVPVTVFAGLGGIATGVFIYHKRSPYEAWAGGAVSFTLGIVIVYVALEWLFQINWYGELQHMLETSVDQTKIMVEQFGGEVSEEQMNLLELQIQQVLYLFPTGIALFGIVFAFISQWIGYKVLKRLGGDSTDHFPPFKRFTLPSALLWYYLIAMVGMWMFNEQGSMFHQAVANVYTLTGLLIALQGISFIFYWIDYKKWPKAIPVVVISGIILFPFLFLYPVRILGIIDIGFHLRDRLESGGK